MISELEEYSNNGKLYNYNISVDALVKFIRECINAFGDNPYGGYDYIIVGENDVDIYGIVVGWSRGFDYEDDDYIDGYGLCIKLAIIEDSMGMEFDDFNMPYTVNGDVWDTNCEISNDPNSPSIVTDAEWILKEWNAFCDAYQDSLELIHNVTEDDEDEDDEDYE